jgi:K+-transporting ATPase ATPase C chain
MIQTLSKSIFLLLSLVVIVCGIYPLALWIVGQTIFPFQANGSMLSGPNQTLVGSKLIAQPFTKDEYFQPRPSAASYDATASASSALAASNYALRDRVARTLGPITQYRNGKPVAPEVEKWFSQDKFQGEPHIVAQWATLHNSLAAAWVTADPAHGAYVDTWSKQHPAVVAQFIKENPAIPQPKAADLAVTFFLHFSKEYPGKFPLSTRSDITAVFFDMWRQDHPDADLQDVPGDLVTTSASGLDPHISLQNAEYQLDRVASKWAADLKRNPSEVKQEIESLLQSNAQAPFYGLLGEKFVNVLEVNLALQKRYGVK